MAPAIIHKVTIHRLAIPMRTAVRHAAAERVVSDPIVVEVELASGLRGFGETLPRPYVTGETCESALKAIEQTFVPAILSFHPESFPEALEAIEALPWHDSDDTPIPAARAAVELALLDVSMQHFGRSLEDIVQWMGLLHFGGPGSIRTVRYGGVLATDDVRSMMRQLRLMYWYGLRNFKVKVGSGSDAERVRAVAKYLAGPIRNRKARLRIDVNGAWTLDQARHWFQSMAGVPIEAAEQPLPRGQEEGLVQLRSVTNARLIHDESLISENDARKLIELGVADGFNIRLGKCGGLLPSIRLAALARKHSVQIQLGCMVGETSILSAAGVRFLEVCPDVQWIEGCFGSFLLRGDVVRKPLRFGYAGRPPRTLTRGWGIDVEESLLKQWALEPARVFNL